MTYEDLLRTRRIRPHELSLTEIAQRLRDLATSAATARADADLEAQSPEGRYQDAYNALRLHAERVMAAEGFRSASGPGQHEILFTFLAQVPEGEWKTLAGYFQRTRRRRNAVAYGQTGAVTPGEVAELIRELDSFTTQIAIWLNKAHPDLVAGE
jgi:hypothetical protein